MTTTSPTRFDKTTQSRQFCGEIGDKRPAWDDGQCRQVEGYQGART